MRGWNETDPQSTWPRSHPGWLADGRGCSARRTNQPPAYYGMDFTVSYHHHWSGLAGSPQASMLLRRDLFLILLRRHQVIERGAGLHPDLDHPALTVGVFGDA